MKLSKIIRRVKVEDLGYMAGLTIVAGFANASLLVVVNGVAEHVARGMRPDFWAWGWFLLAFGTYFAANRAALLRANLVIEDLLRDLRLEIADKIRQCELLVVDRMDRAELYTLVSQETNHLSFVFPLLVDCIQQVALLLASLLYMAYLSRAALLLFLVTVTVGALFYGRLGARLSATLERVNAGQARMLDRVTDILDGFKEVRLHEARSEAVYEAFEETSQGTHRELVIFGEDWVSLIMIGSFVSYYMLAVVGFLFPQYVTGHGTIVYALMPTILFCMGPLFKIVGVLPMVIRAEVGVGAIFQIMETLEEGGGVTTDEARERAEKFRNFENIEYSGIEFSYRGPDGEKTFTSGPWDLTLGRGEIVFLVGGNGSGKSTALRLMTGLYPSDAGEVRVDGQPVSEANLAGLRELFASIFMDFHLFDRLYGVGQVDPQAVTSLIETMGLAHKVGFENGRFTDIQLSTGQRKRLALIATILEDRPVYIFDEWPAEQDQEFREHFYFHILPMLKARGATVVAVTHDDRYWHLGDRVLRLELGKVMWEKPGEDLAETAGLVGAGDEDKS